MRSFGTTLKEFEVKSRLLLGAVLVNFQFFIVLIFLCDPAVLKMFTFY